MEEEDNAARIALAPRKDWLGKLLPPPQIVFICQMVVIYVVIGVSLFNLTQGNGEGAEGKLWIALLSSCLGYMLPNPKVEIPLKQL